MTDIALPRSRFIPWLFVAGMLVVVAVNGALIYFAATTWSGMSVSRAYERGLTYNRALDAAARQDALGWSVDARFEAGRLVVVAADRNGRELADLRIAATLERPVGDARRRQMILMASAGAYVAEMGPLAAGQWDLRLTVERGADVIYVTRRLFVP